MATPTSRPSQWYEAYIFDLDGTVYLGDALLPTAGETLTALRARGRRLALAEVLARGGFPAEMLAPIREALGWALTSLLALHQDREPSSDLPAPRLVQAQLVEPGYVADDLAARLARVRELTEPPAVGEAILPPTVKAGEALVAAVRELIEVGHERIVVAGL